MCGFCLTRYHKVHSNVDVEDKAKNLPIFTFLALLCYFKNPTLFFKLNLANPILAQIVGEKCLLPNQTEAELSCGMTNNMQGRPSSPRQWCISLCFRFTPYFLNKFILANFPNLTFSRKSFRFSSTYISDELFLVIEHEFLISPLFFVFQYISLYLYKFPPCFRKIHVFFRYFICISFPPYFDHDAFMHQTMHIGYWTPLIRWKNATKQTHNKWGIEGTQTMEV